KWWIASQEMRNMAVLTIVGGLPGSGKTTCLNQLRKERVDLGLVESDYKKDSISHRAEMIHSKHHDNLVPALAAGKDCVIADIVFVRRSKQCEIQDLIRSKVPGVTIQWVIFENDWEQCIRNVQRGDPDPMHATERIQRINELKEHHHV